MEEIDNTRHSELIAKLHLLVEEAVKEESLIIHNLENPPEELLTEGQKLSDKVAMFGGSWKFIIYFGVFLAIWIIVNVITKTPFDPYPFILMNLILSCIAALQAPIIMMSQNRKEEKDRKRAENDYMINLKAEIEIRNLHQKIDLLMEEQILSLMESQKAMMKLIVDLKKD
ncbi:MAG: DUF1003 domain-containing protein [Opitutaceae bacterium]|nr:DUF1003 domain-containing protein [Cytophagales bacterium]